MPQWGLLEELLRSESRTRGGLGELEGYPFARVPSAQIPYSKAEVSNLAAVVASPTAPAGLGTFSKIVSGVSLHMHCNFTPYPLF